MLIDFVELPRPVNDIEERSEIMTVIVRVVCTHVHGGRQNRTLMSIHGVEPEKSLYLGCNLEGPVATISPFDKQSQITGPRAKFFNLS